MASLGFQISFFFLFVLVLSPQIQAREGKVFSLFSHFRATNTVKDHQDLPEKPKAESPTEAPITAPTEAPIEAPITAPIEAPVTAPTIDSEITGSGPAPEPDFVDMGNGYGLYGTDDSKSQYYSPNKESPTTTTTNFENQLLNEDFTGDSYRTDKSSSKFYNNNNNEEVYRNNNNYNNEEVYRNNNNYNNEEEYRNNNAYNNEEEYRNNNNYNNEEEYRNNNYNNGYNKKYADNSYSNNNYNEERYSNNNYDEESYSNNNYNGNEYNNYNSNNGYEVKREGMSDTRFMEDGKYYYPMKGNHESYNLNEYESVRGNTENEGFYDKTRYPNEFDTMEEYEKQQESQGYTP